MSNGRRGSHGSERREYIRHPSSVPVACYRTAHQESNGAEMRDISHGGMRFASTDRFGSGDVVLIEFPTLMTNAALLGEIVWEAADEPPPGRMSYGMRFLNENMHFRARMVEQICHIEAYRDAQQSELGRRLSPEEAAAEWIERCAAHFGE